ncbi:MAG: hydantoinase/oxoprolinase family protein [Promethearchaeota archaeon]
MRTLGLDVGGANTKMVVINHKRDRMDLEFGYSAYFPFWEKKNEFKDFLKKIKNSKLVDVATVGVTMTAELSDCFDTKAEGVEYITRALDSVFPDARFYSVVGEFLTAKDAINQWNKISAANWHATASLVGKNFPNCLFIDIGSTSTDIIPIIDGTPTTNGKDDVTRTIYSELLYTGALRTNLIALTGMERIPFRDTTIRGSSEYFACTADVYRVLGFIDDDEYTIDTPDGRGTSVEECLSRIAKFICGDLHVIERSILIELCENLMKRQINIITTAIQEVLDIHGLGHDLLMTITGSGFFLAEKAIEKAGFKNCLVLNSQHAGITGDIEFSPALAIAVLVKERMT